MRRVKFVRLNDESGMVSIMVTMILIIVMTLIVLAMSQDSNRQQRQSLDRQLSDQAFYNAESGINDWKNYLDAYSTSSTLPVEKKECSLTTYSGPSVPTPVPTPDVISGDTSNQYTCVLYDRAPTTIEYSKLLPGDGQTVELLPKDGGQINNLTFSWTFNPLVASCNNNITTTSVLPSNCNTAGLQVSLIDSGASPIRRSDLINNAYISYMFPRTSGGATTDNFASRVGPANQGGRVLTNCTSAGCTMKIQNINKNRLLLHLETLYTSPDKIVISGQKPDGTAVRFVGAQTMIDSTGRSQDVLRRVRVRIPTQNSSSTIGFSALRTALPICKLLTVDKAARTATLDPSNGCPVN